jgi:hypothetical protein
MHSSMRQQWRGVERVEYVRDTFVLVHYKFVQTTTTDPSVRQATTVVVCMKYVVRIVHVVCFGQ